MEHFPTQTKAKFGFMGAPLTNNSSPAYSRKNALLVYVVYIESIHRGLKSPKTFFEIL